MAHHGLLNQPAPTLLPDNPPAKATVKQAREHGMNASDVAATYPTYSDAWAVLAWKALADDDTIAAYAYARTGYHRGLDALRRAGWKGHGPIPWNHEPNQGFLRCLAALGRAAEIIGESDEASRCRQFLHDSDPDAQELARG